MSQFKTIAIVAASSLLLAAPIAFADETSPAMTSAEETTANDTKSYIKAEYNEEVRGALENGDMIAVRDEDGTIYYNHFVSESELPDPRLELDTVDTYTYEYQGRTYTNKIVEED